MVQARRLVFYCTGCIGYVVGMLKGDGVGSNLAFMNYSKTSPIRYPQVNFLMREEYALCCSWLIVPWKWRRSLLGKITTRFNHVFGGMKSNSYEFLRHTVLLHNKKRMHLCKFLPRLASYKFLMVRSPGVVKFLRKSHNLIQFHFRKVCN